ncbi:glycine betaine ABC transporter substrate-binding protein [Streptacidiphilus jiangxiensis]|uniref:Substrate binding domain of ABC-type glycine betaine transport system n=1 Tax=Streptacidiphilus jiangxiensis TaxID=235985 RepID=A0A1H7UR21_STRJI|nr:glycine betaine ABC transporter substrate-binding protein [Streptacidiphilus jiangxiensis]SEL99246.1 Substrate binding domain of ABC-type glycine betaine transport system [Streptacidiphilus jiangxiensis]
MKKALTSALVAACAVALAACGSSGSSGANGLSTSGGASPSGGGSTIAAKLVLGGSPEFKTRPDGIPGLERVYGVTFGSYKTLDAGGPLTVNALKNGQIDAGDIFTTDPSIQADGFVVLQDPKNLYAAQNVLPLINKAKATPGVTSTLKAVSDTLDTSTLTTLNVHVITDKQDPAAVAQGWLTQVGLAKHGTAAQGVSVKIGSANFQENVLLAEIYAEALRDQGATVTTRLNIGSRETYIPGLKDGSIDLIPEYSGVLLQYFDPKATAVSSADVYAALQKVVPAPLTVLDQSSAQDKDAIVVTKATADKYHLTSIADLAKNG